MLFLLGPKSISTPRSADAIYVNAECEINFSATRNVRVKTETTTTTLVTDADASKSPAFCFRLYCAFPNHIRWCFKKIISFLKKIAFYTTRCISHYKFRRKIFEKKSKPDRNKRGPFLRCTYAVTLYRCLALFECDVSESTTRSARCGPVYTEGRIRKYWNLPEVPFRMPQKANMSATLSAY